MAYRSYTRQLLRLVNACPRLDVIKRSTCIEGARMAFARIKVWWAKMDAVKLVTEGPPKGKDHRSRRGTLARSSREPEL